MAEAKCAEFKNDLIYMLTGADKEKYEIVGDRMILCFLSIQKITLLLE